MKLSDMLERSEDMAEKQFRDLPDDRAVVQAMLGMYHSSLGAMDKAEGLLNRAIDSARGSPDVSLKARLNCQHATILQSLGKVDEAQRHLKLIANRSDIDAETAAECFAYLSYAARELNDGPGAVASTQHAIERLNAAPRPMPVSRATLAGDLASGLQLSGRNDEAQQQFAVAMQMFAALGRETSAEAITVLNNWGQVDLGGGDAKAALLRFDAILAVDKRNGSTELPYHALAGRGTALHLLGRYVEAADSFEQALTGAQAGGHETMQAYSLAAAGAAAREMGQLEKAESYLNRVERLDASARPQGSSAAAVEHILRARIALSRGDLPLARAEFSVLLENRRANSGIVNALLGRAEVELRDGRLERAAADAHDALQLARSLQGRTPYSVRTGLAWLLEGEIRTRAGDAAAARQAYSSALDQLGHSVDASHPALRRAQALVDGAVAVSVR